MNTDHSNPQEAIARRRRWTPEEKRAAVEKTREPGRSLSSVARELGIFPSQLLLWKRNMENGAFMGISEEGKIVAEAELKELRKRCRSLERMLGRKTEEVEILKEGIEIARKKKLISHVPLQGVEGFQ